MKFLMFGAPMAGKGTLANMLAEDYHLPTISMGDILRESIESGSEEGKIAKGYMDKGVMVPTALVAKMIKNRLAMDDVQEGFILDGFPRTIPQAQSLEEILQELNMKLDYVIQIFVPKEEILDRLTGRRICKNCGTSYHIKHYPSEIEGKCDVCGGDLTIRKDDNMESVLVRLDAYEKQTKPLLEYYQNQGLLIHVDGKQDIHNVFKDIVNELGEK